MSEATMAWVDMETTGLEVDFDVPLELGIVLTDDHLNVIGQYSWLVCEGSDAYQLGIGRGMSNDIVRAMHIKSGLWDALKGDDMKYTRDEVDADVCNFLESHEVEFGTLPMCGSSIGSLDRPFALRHFPHFNEALSYRSIDVSSIKEVCRRVNKDLFANLRAEWESKEDAPHRVIGDCMASIYEYQQYLDNLIITGDEY